MDLQTQLRGQLWGQLEGQLRGQFGPQLRVQLGDQLGGQLLDQLLGQLLGQLRGQLWDQATSTQLNITRRGKMKTTGWIQQGDVLIQQANIPTLGRNVVGRVLMEGELTGHAHRLTAESDGMVVEVAGSRYLSVGRGGARVEHEEHKAVDLLEGEYRIGRVQEYDHFAEEARVVRD